METIFILFVLIVALIGLVGLRKENESKDNLITGYIKKNKDLEKQRQFDRHNLREQYQLALIDIEEEKDKIKKSNSSNQGWNVKYRKTIEKLEKKVDWQWKLEKGFDIMSQKVDESKILTEKLLTMVKKKDMEEAKAIVKSYYQM